jgi:hypothetical protein
VCAIKEQVPGVPTLLMAWRLATERTQKQVVAGVRGLVGGCGLSEQQLSRWENGHDGVGEFYRRQLAAYYQTDQHRLGLAAAPVAPAEPTSDTGELVGPPWSTGEDDVERRTLLQLLGGVTIAGPVPGRLEHARRGVEHLLPSALSDRDLDEWERTADAYSEEVGAVAPATILPNLVADLAELRDLFDTRLSTPAHQRLLHVAGQLSALTAITMINLAQVQAARRWWRTAWRIADQVGDPQLSSYIRGRQAVLALYGGYTADQVLVLADDAAHAGQGVACAGTISGLAARAQALSVLGRPREATDALNGVRSLFDRLPDTVTARLSSQYGWPEHKLRHVESYVHTRLGDARAAGRAQDQALRLYPPTNYQGSTQIHLHRAACLILDGHLSEGATYATNVLQAMTPAHRRDGLITRSAYDVLAAVPANARTLTPVRRYRQTLAATPGAGPE